MDLKYFLKRGNTKEAESFVGHSGEIVLDKEAWNLYIHDGVTVGGIFVELPPLARIELQKYYLANGKVWL